MACGSRICGRNAKLTRGDGGSYFLPRIVGPAKARELYLLSPVLGGEEAEAIGRVTEVAEPGRVLQAALCLRRRSPRARRYGLANVVFPIGPDRFLEVVAPIRAGTAAGRFLELAQGHGGYMLIFDCDDPKARTQRAQALDVRLANHIDKERYQGYQLHPKDCKEAA